MMPEQREAAPANIVPMILAAGDSTRMGYPKALLPLGRNKFLTAILEKVEGLGFSPALVILGRDAPRIQPFVANFQARVLINPDPGRGQLSSIQLGVAHLDPGRTGCMIWPVDLPAVPADLVGELADLFVRSGAMITLPRCGGRNGHPAILHSELFQPLLSLPLCKGAKELIQSHSRQTSVLETTELSTIDDVDTPEDYRKLTGETLQSALERTAGGH
jgi:molybdenum cofactor cytidylyltransferase